MYGQLNAQLFSCTDSLHVLYIKYAYGDVVVWWAWWGDFACLLRTAETLWEQVSAILTCGINLIISGFILQWIVLDLLIMLVVLKVWCRAYEITLSVLVIIRNRLLLEIEGWSVDDDPFKFVETWFWSVLTYTNNTSPIHIHIHVSGNVD